MQQKVSRRVLARTIAAQLLARPKDHARIVRTVAAYLIEQRMADDAQLFMGDLAHELFVQSGHLFAEVASAHTLGESVRAELVRTLRHATGAKHVEIAEQVKPELLGGLTVRTPDAQLDLSVRSTLQQLASVSSR